MTAIIQSAQGHCQGDAMGPLIAMSRKQGEMLGYPADHCTESQDMQ